MGVKQQFTTDLGEDHDRVKRTACAQFDRWAATYDRSRLAGLVFLPSLRACREEIVRWQRRCGPAPYSLLDVGCGTGNLLAALADDPFAQQLIGLDYSPEMVRLAAAKLALCGPPERLRAIHGDAERLPFEDGFVDVLTCCHSFHHYPRQPAVLREFHRVLRPDGLLILIDGFRDNVIGWVIFDVFVAWAERNVHHAAWSELRQAIEHAGFRSLAQRKLNVLAPLLVNVALR